MMMDKYKFGEFIYAQRKKLGYTQEELGRKLKVTNKAVSKWETGETLPDIQLLPELASVLNVTIDELLTQRKASVVVEEAPKPKSNLFLWIMCSVLIVVVISLAVIIFDVMKKPKPVEITVENATDYFEITPCQNFVIEGQGIDIYGSIRAKEGLTDPSLVLKFTVQYFYINTDGDISEVVYLDRHVSYDSLTDDFSIILRPKSQINNFGSFYKVEVSYEVVEASGRFVE